jgi:hypothetical protein
VTFNSVQYGYVLPATQLITDFQNVSGADFEVIDTGPISTNGC